MIQCPHGGGWVGPGWRPPKCKGDAVRSWPQRGGPWAVGRLSGSLVLGPRAGHGPSELPGLFNRPVLSGPETLHHLPSAARRPHDLSGGWRYTSRAAGDGSSGWAGLDSASTPIDLSTPLHLFVYLCIYSFFIFFPVAVSIKSQVSC